MNDILKADHNRFIKLEFKQYKKFISSDLPEFNITYINGNNWAYFNSEDLFNHKYLLHVDSNFFDNQENFIKSVLFHEFTHLFDSINCFRYDNLKAFTSYMDTYSEYHASKIQMMKLLKFTSLNEIKQVLPAQSCTFEKQIITVQRYADYYFNECKNRLQIADLSKFVSDFRNLMYFCGIVDFYSSYCDVSYQVKLNEMPKPYDKYSALIYKLLKNFNLKNNCQELFNLRKIFNNEYSLNTKKKLLRQKFSKDELTDSDIENITCNTSNKEIVNMIKYRVENSLGLSK